VPPAKEALEEGSRWRSLEVIAAVSFVLMRLKLASTALTVTVKAVAAVCGVGAPLLPVAAPGAALSPAASTCTRGEGPRGNGGSRAHAGSPAPVGDIGCRNGSGCQPF